MSRMSDGFERPITVDEIRKKVDLVLREVEEYGEVRDPDVLYLFQERLSSKQDEVTRMKRLMRKEILEALEAGDLRGASEVARMLKIPRTRYYSIRGGMIGAERKLYRDVVSEVGVGTERNAGKFALSPQSEERLLRELERVRFEGLREMKKTLWELQAKLLKRIELGMATMSSMQASTIQTRLVKQAILLERVMKAGDLGGGDGSEKTDEELMVEAAENEKKLKLLGPVADASERERHSDNYE